MGAPQLAALAALLTALGAALAAVPAMRRSKARRHPMAKAAGRLARFWEGRPLPAVLEARFGSAHEAALEAKKDFPGCDAGELRRAAWEAEYNEFLKYRLADEARAMKRQLDRRDRAVRRIVSGILDGCLDRIPSGIQARILGIRKDGYVAYDRTFCYSLGSTHTWLDQAAPLPGGISHAERFEALATSRFRCAWCGQDWDDGAELGAVRTRSGALAICCSRCRDRLPDGRT